MTKVFHFAVCLLLAATLQNCTQPTTSEPTAAQAPNPKQDEAAILHVIENESRDFYKKDHAAWASHYVHSPKVHWVCVETDVTLRANGWDDLSKFVADWMKDNPEPMDYDKANFQNSNLQVTVNGDLAFVTMLESNTQPDGSLRQLIGSRTLLRENGEWKILSMTSYPSDSPAGSTGNVYVHGGGE
jgi:ketosteroid isomerase-like protein